MGHNIIAADRRRSRISLIEEFGEVMFFDVTIEGDNPVLSRLDPRYPHGDLVVPFTDEKLKAASLEAIVSAFRVCEHEGADLTWLQKSGKEAYRRKPKELGALLGYQRGSFTDKPLLSEIEFRKLVYVPLYKWQLEHHCQEALSILRDAHEKSDIVLLAGGCDRDICDVLSSISYPTLIAQYLLGTYPDSANGYVWKPYTQAEHDDDIARRATQRKYRVMAQRSVRATRAYAQAPAPAPASRAIPPQAVRLGAKYFSRAYESQDPFLISPFMLPSKYDMPEVPPPSEGDKYPDMESLQPFCNDDWRFLGSAAATRAFSAVDVSFVEAGGAPKAVIKTVGSSVPDVRGQDGRSRAASVAANDSDVKKGVRTEPLYKLDYDDSDVPF